MNINKIKKAIEYAEDHMTSTGFFNLEPLVDVCKRVLEVKAEMPLIRDGEFYTYTDYDKGHDDAVKKCTLSVAGKLTAMESQIWERDEDIKRLEVEVEKLKKETTMNIKIECENGKYTWILEGGKVTCLRYGEAWRDETGDGAILALMQKIKMNQVTEEEGVMENKVKGNHPLAEVIAKKLFGIEGCPPECAKRMVNNACKAAVEWYENTRVKLEEAHGVDNNGNLIRYGVGNGEVR